MKHDTRGIAAAGSAVRGARANGAQPRALVLLWRFAHRVAEYGRRRIEHAIERQRMNSIRRHPTGVATLAKSAKHILVVCHGNINRSAFAARLVAQTVGDHTPVSVSSGGLAALPGSPSPPHALHTARGLGVDLSSHASAVLTAESVANADLIFVMDIPQVVAMRKRFPQARRRTFLLTCLAPDGPLEIDDPDGGDASVFQTCFDDISRAVRPIVRVLTDARGRA